MRDIKGIMGDLFREEGMDEFALLMELRERWGEIAGEELAERTRPYRLEGKRLYVGVDSHATSQDLHYLEEKIKEALRRMFGIDDIKITTRKITLK